MIKSFKHKGLELFFNTGNTAKIQAKHAKRLRLILGMLNTAETPEDMDAPGLNLHPLKGSHAGTFAVKVSGNWRVTFNLVKADVFNVNYEDYH